MAEDVDLRLQPIDAALEMDGANGLAEARAEEVALLGAELHSRHKV